MSESHKEAGRGLFLPLAATSYKKMLWKCLWCWLWSMWCIKNQKVAKLQKATGRKWIKRLNNSAFLRILQIYSPQILTVNYSTEAELSAACNRWRHPFTSDKKKIQRHTLIVFHVKKISEKKKKKKENKWDIGTSLGSVWDQWVRAGTKAAKLSNSSWQLLRIWVTPHPQQLLMKMSHLFGATLPIWGGGPRVGKCSEQIRCGCSLCVDRSRPRKETMFSWKRVHSFTPPPPPPPPPRSSISQISGSRLTGTFGA